MANVEHGFVPDQIMNAVEIVQISAELEEDVSLEMIVFQVNAALTPV
jgi:hypothetical protein